MNSDITCVYRDRTCKVASKQHAELRGSAEEIITMVPGSLRALSNHQLNIYMLQPERQLSLKEYTSLAYSADLLFLVHLASAELERKKLDVEMACCSKHTALITTTVMFPISGMH